MTTPPTPTDHAKQSARQARLEALYLADGRDDPGHKMHNLYTGLCVDNQPTSEEQPNEQ
jgi:hypothetical protein